MHIGELTVAAERLWPGEDWVDVPLAFVDLDRTPDLPESLVLPPCPVIGLGDRAHPLAARLDAVVEPPVDPGMLARQVLAMPRAAAVIVQLLRLLPDLSVEAALTAESLAYVRQRGMRHAAGQEHGHLARAGDGVAAGALQQLLGGHAVMARHHLLHQLHGDAALGGVRQLGLQSVGGSV